MRFNAARTVSSFMSTLLGQLGTRGVRLGRIAGIPVTLDWTWFPIAFLLVFGISSSLAEALGTPGAIVTAVLLATGFFASILAHEFGHALVARRYGIRTESIALHVFGGVARLTSEPRRPAHEFWVAAAGPAVSLALALAFFLISATIPVKATLPFMVIYLAAWQLAWANLILGVFNLIPGFPLDGGRILRAILWHRRRSWREGTRVAARAGAIVGAIMIGLGLAIGVLTDDAFRGIMLAGVGLMVRQAARAEELRARLTSGPFGPGGFGPGPASARIPDSVQVVRLPDGQIAVIRDPSPPPPDRR
ncbi:MAG: site-2 protease family protein [Planctomycetes bacterium]|nr:site-2 protease family protein [Planctomycetota bacterium]